MGDGHVLTHQLCWTSEKGKDCPGCWSENPPSMKTTSWRCLCIKNTATQDTVLDWAGWPDICWQITKPNEQIPTHSLQKGVHMEQKTPLWWIFLQWTFGSNFQRSSEARKEHVIFCPQVQTTAHSPPWNTYLLILNQTEPNQTKTVYLDFLKSALNLSFAWF